MMTANPWAERLTRLENALEGELLSDQATRAIYATDASVYRELPLAVAFPRGEADIGALIRFANEEGTSLIPRAAGTSLAGQVVGGGIVVDVSRHMTRILEIDVPGRRVRVEPGVVRNELNAALQPHGLMFAPETATANRAMIGGMVGNNSCGVNSLVHGSTRDHLLEATVFLADGSRTVLRSINDATFARSCAAAGIEGDIHRHLRDTLSVPETAAEITREFPKPSIRRRNTGYAVDLLLRHRPFAPNGGPFNLCTLLAGSEGTLAFATELVLNLVPLPPKERCVVAVHLNSVHEATRATLVALKHKPLACELIDRMILRCAAQHIGQRKNLFFVDGDPGVLLVIGLAKETPEEVTAAATALIADLKAGGHGYAFPVLRGADVDRIWELRRAGHGVMSNIIGDAKPVSCIEDTAVDVEDQPAYLEEFEKLLVRHGMDCVFSSHIGDGEIHLSPVLDLKKGPDRARFRAITSDVADLVKRYRGSMSGEHGDGRVRGPFLKRMIGERNYALLRDLKRTWDPRGIFNPGKIVEVPPMTESLRFEEGQVTRDVATTLDFSKWGGVLRLAEQCSGSGDCRKSPAAGGTMCPSYMATRDEKDSTRARANLLREFLTRSPRANPFDHEELHDVLDLCLSCKGCKSECPSSVDMGLLKAEFQQQFHDARGTPFRAKILGRFASGAKWASRWPAAANAIAQGSWTGKILRRVLGLAPNRSLPLFSQVTFSEWAAANPRAFDPPPGVERRGKVHFFCDEFTNHLEPGLGRAAIELWTRLGYSVVLPLHAESARALISKGLLREARTAARDNVRLLSRVISNEAPLVGLEPSAILGFRDEFPLLVGGELKEDALALSPNCLLFEEWFMREVDAGRISADAFIETSKTILLHGHCHQKALSGMEAAVRALSVPVGHKVEVIPSGCCGMAGSFGYEREHFDLSMAIGELVLFPTVRRARPDAVIVAPGTSCRHQIRDGTGRASKHTVEILRASLRARG